MRLSSAFVLTFVLLTASCVVPHGAHSGPRPAATELCASCGHPLDGQRAFGRPGRERAPLAPPHAGRRGPEHGPFGGPPPFDGGPHGRRRGGPGMREREFDGPPAPFAGGPRGGRRGTGHFGPPPGDRDERGPRGDGPRSDMPHGGPPPIDWIERVLGELDLTPEQKARAQAHLDELRAHGPNGAAPERRGPGAEHPDGGPGDAARPPRGPAVWREILGEERFERFRERMRALRDGGPPRSRPGADGPRPPSDAGELDAVERRARGA